MKLLQGLGAESAVALDDTVIASSIITQVSKSAIVVSC